MRFNTLEAEKVHRVTLALRRMGDKFARLPFVQAKARLDDALQARALLIVELPVDGGEMNQQGGGGELIVGGLERRFTRRAAREVAEKGFKGVEHRRGLWGSRVCTPIEQRVANV